MAYGAPTGDGSIIVGPTYFHIEDGGATVDTPAKVYDVKTPGTFVDAADGPNLFGTGSVVSHCYLHHADDTIKMSASSGHYYRNTVLHGNTGSVVLLANFGLGLFNSALTGALADGVYVHYIWMQGDEMQGGGTHTGIVGMQTCMNEDSEIEVASNTVMQVYVPDLGEGRLWVNRAVSIGALDPGYTWNQANGGFCKRTDNKWIWGVHLTGLFLKYWNVYQEPEWRSLIFSNMDEDMQYQRGKLEVDKSSGYGIEFYDTAEFAASGYDFDNLKETALKIYSRRGDGTSYFYMVCGTDGDTQNCMEEGGAHWQVAEAAQPPYAPCFGTPDGCENLEAYMTEIGDSRLEFPWHPK